jgi:uncharacterized protein YdhG (YjbR/CyaY superfamily)
MIGLTSVTAPAEDVAIVLKPASVEAYLAALPPERRERFERLRAIVLGAVSEAVEVISYDMPAYRMGSRFVCSIGAFTKHDSLFPASQAVIDALGEDAAPYVKGRGTFQFPHSRELPAALIEQIVRIRLEETRAAIEASDARR